MGPSAHHPNLGVRVQSVQQHNCRLGSELDVSVGGQNEGVVVVQPLVLGTRPSSPPVAQVSNVLLDAEVEHIVHVHHLTPPLLVLHLEAVLEVDVDGHGVHYVPAQLTAVGGVDPLEHLWVHVQRLLKQREQLERKVGQLGPVCTPVQEYVRLKVVPVAWIRVLLALVVARQLVYGGQHLLHLFDVFPVHGRADEDGAWPRVV